MDLKELEEITGVHTRPGLRVLDEGESPEQGIGRPPIIVFYPGAAVMWVRTNDEHYVPTDARALRIEMKHHQPHIDLWVPGKGDSFKPVTAGQLLEQHGRRVDKIFYDLTSDETRYLHDGGSGGDLYIACARRPIIEPVFHEEVDTWLRLLFGDRADVGLDWLATLGILTRPSAALYIQGEKGNGKGLLAEGCSAYFGGSFTTYDDIAGTGFNSSLKHCPVVFLDEKIGDNAARRGSGFFRSFIASSRHNLSEKNRPSATLIGCVRMIIAANNPDALRIKEKLTPEDEDAIGERIAHINISNTAGAYLRKLGGRPHTANWVRNEQTGEPGELCQYLAWLEANREVIPGCRFIVHGSSVEWLKRSAQRAGPKQEVLVALAKICSGAGPKEPTLWPVMSAGEFALVFPSLLRDCWRDVTGNATTYNTGTFGQELKSLAGGKSRKVRIAGGKRRQGWLVPAQLILDVAVEMGVGDIDEICTEYDLEPPAGWELDE